MPPKKTAATRGRGRPRAQPTRNIIPSRANFDDSESEDTTNSSELKAASSQTRTLLGSHNSLKQLLAGPSAQPKSLLKTPPKRNGRAAKRNVALSPISSASTPISRLKHATEQLGLSDGRGGSPIRFDDIEVELPPQKKRRPGRPRKNVEPSTSDAVREKKVASRRSAPQSNGRSRKTPKIEEFPQDDESYVEQVSHHEINLTDDTNVSNNNIRRSSYNNRGKRGSSIGNGFVAKPHSEVAVHDYYKHLDSSLSDPHRVRQLLSWCYQKSSDGGEIENNETNVDVKTVRGITNAIEREYLDDLTNGSISTSWYSLGDNPAQDEGQHFRIPGIVRPNPSNESNKESIEVFKKKLENLRAEKAQLLKAHESSISSLKDLHVNRVVPEEELREHLRRKDSVRKLSENVLDSSFFKQMQTDVELAKGAVDGNLEFNVDELRILSYRLRQRASLASKVSKQVLEPEFANLVHAFRGPDEQSDSRQGPSTLELLKGIAKLDQQKTLSR